MTLWWIAFFCLFLGILDLRPAGVTLLRFLRQGQQIRSLKQAGHHLKLLQEFLESGLVPEPSDWKKVSLFSAPWGELFAQSLNDLRSQGAPVLPSLFRMQRTLEEQVELILEGKVKSSQALGQAVLGLVLVPFFTAILYWMLPEVQNARFEFFLLALGSMILSGVAFLWIVSMADDARFGNLPLHQRSWLTSSSVLLEKLVALISTGMPPDLAWRNALEEIGKSDASIVELWGGLIWEEPEVSTRRQNATAELIERHGKELKRTIQTALIEGRATLDRLESLQRSFQIDLKMRISQELGLLPNRSLKALFIFVLPSVMALLLGAMMMVMSEMGVA